MGEVKLDCIHYTKWNMTTLAYSICDKYHRRLIDMGGNGCRKNCKYYKIETPFNKTMKEKSIAQMSYKKLFKFFEGMSDEDLLDVECKIMMPRQMFNSYFNSYKGIKTDDGDLYGIALFSNNKKNKAGLAGVLNLGRVKKNLKPFIDWKEKHENN